MKTVKNYTSEDIYKELALLDYECGKTKVKAQLVLLGGSGLLVLLESLGDSFRPTLDIDVNILDTSDPQKLTTLAKKMGIDLNCVFVPPTEDFRDDENRYKLDIDFENIEVYVPSPELLACTKLLTTRGKDLEDLVQSSILEQCNLDILKKMVNDYALYVSNPNDPELNFLQLNRILEEKGL